MPRRRRRRTCCPGRASQRGRGSGRITINPRNKTVSNLIRRHEGKRVGVNFHPANEGTYPVYFAVNLPNAPFPLVLDRLLDVPDPAIPAPPLSPQTRPAALRHEPGPPPARVGVYLAPGHLAAEGTHLAVAPPGDNLPRVLEAARAHVQPVEHGRGVVAVLLSCLVVLAAAAGGFGGRRGRVAEQLLAVVAGVPCSEAEVAQHDFIYVAVCPRGLAVGGGGRGGCRRRRRLWRRVLGRYSGWRDRGDDGGRQTGLLDGWWRPVWPDQGGGEGTGHLLGQMLGHMVGDFGRDEV